jgi:predicted nucleic acid-binding protein
MNGTLSRKVFFDANILIQAGKPPGGPVIKTLVALVDANLIRTLTTDLTSSEVAKKHAQNDFDAVKDIAKRHFRELTRQITGVALPEINSAEVFRNRLVKYKSDVADMMRRLNAENLNVSDADVSKIFNDYMLRQGVFSKDAKKDQFPDAFIIATLRAKASSASPITIVTKDSDYSAALRDDPFFHICSSISDLLEDLGLKESTADLSGFLSTSQSVLIDKFSQELEDWGINILDHEDGEVDSLRVVEVDIDDATSFSSVEAGGPVLLVGSATLKIEVEWSGPSWDSASYDSEDKVLIPWEGTGGNAETELNVSFSMSIRLNDDGVPDEIEDVSLSANSVIWIYVHADDFN